MKAGLRKVYSIGCPHLKKKQTVDPFDSLSNWYVNDMSEVLGKIRK